MSSHTSAFGPIHWQDYSHQEMWQMVESANPKAMFEHAVNAKHFADAMGGVTNYANKVANDILSAWSGTSADNAAAAINKFLRWADETANTASRIALLLDQYAHVLNRAKLEMPYPLEAGKPTSQGQVATEEQASASKTHAVHVMQHYTTQSEQIYGELQNHQFTAPPTGTGLPLDPPTPEPTPAPAPLRPLPTPPPGPVTTPTSSGTSTTLSDFAGLPSGGATTVTPGLPDLGGMPGGVVGGAPAGSSTAGGFGGVPGMSGISPAAEAETRLARMGVERPAGREGFTPMQPFGRAGRDQDGQHRNKYRQSPDLIGDLPPACPPVLGHYAE